MTTLSPTAGLRHACTVLSTPGLIRLVTEIDDNGPIPPRGLTHTLPDLSVHHLQQAVGQARALALVRHQPGVGLSLTPSGSGLADVYDVLARVARRHRLPAPVCDFTSRVQHALTLLTMPVLATEQAEGASRTAAEDLDGTRALLQQWLQENPHLGKGTEPVLAA
ncbi:regulator [Streptomyces sp. NPDC017673]|uniref:regulator n=1 Tax=unclassified Streptomyces TaxID=2593676 RepID=UPI00379E2C64